MVLAEATQEAVHAREPITLCTAHVSALQA